MATPEPQKFPPEVFSLFDKYVHGAISRRDFIDRASALAIAGMSGAALLEALSPKFALAVTIAAGASPAAISWNSIYTRGSGVSRR